jgi:hypothetical protein
VKQKKGFILSKNFYVFIIISVLATIALLSQYIVKNNPFAKVREQAASAKNDCHKEEIVKESNICDVKENDSLYVGCNGFF